MKHEDEPQRNEYSYFVSPAEVIGSASVKGDYFQAHSPVEIAISMTAQAAEQQKQLNYDVDGRAAHSLARTRINSEYEELGS
ncbi:hypothetical protein V7S43_013201 [Phytophthora oleae]|uniref:Uncharacterized protein n=1 Tax=Phytophthora oleae TaxID=2107226 RepID=A0ABD3F504_9STRA